MQTPDCSMALQVFRPLYYLSHILPLDVKLPKSGKNLLRSQQRKNRGYFRVCQRALSHPSALGSTSLCHAGSSPPSPRAEVPVPPLSPVLPPTLHTRALPFCSHQLPRVGHSSPRAPERAFCSFTVFSGYKCRFSKSTQQIFTNVVALFTKSIVSL